jgi:hypothetical protein
MCPKCAAGVAPVRPWLLVGVVFGVVACSGRRVPVPAIPAEQAGQEALAQYDINKDGFLDKDELKHCPALASSLKALDKNRDGRLSGSEKRERISSYQTNRIGLAALAVKITLDGKPLAGATVTLVPEKFLGGAIKPAAGVTDTRGVANVATEGVEVPGVACGMFRIQVSKKDTGGRETLPARYNQNTTLGVEVGPDLQGALRLALLGS